MLEAHSDRIFALLEFESLQDVINANNKLNATDVHVKGQLLWIDLSHRESIYSKLLIFSGLPCVRHDRNIAELEDEVRRAFQFDGPEPLVRYWLKSGRYERPPTRGYAAVGFRSVEEARRVRERVGIEVKISGGCLRVGWFQFAPIAPSRTLRLIGIAKYESRTDINAILDEFRGHGFSPMRATRIRFKGALNGRAYVESSSTVEATRARDLFGGGRNIVGRLVTIDFALPATTSMNSAASTRQTEVRR